MRMHGHGAHDDMGYVPAELLAEWAARDPIERYAARLVEELGFAAGEVERIAAEVATSPSAPTALASPMPDPATAAEGVFADGWPSRSATASAPWSGWASPRPYRVRPSRSRLMAELTYLRGDLRRPARRRCAATNRVFCLGEDIGAFGGAFKVTDGFAAEFGAERVLDTPLAENAIIGAATGAAIEGMRPVCEMQFADFIACGFDQLVNVAGEDALPAGPSVPMVRPAALRRRLLRRPVPLAEPGGLVPAGAGPEGGGAGDRRRTPRACWRARSATPTRSASSSTRASTAASATRCPRASYRCRSTARVAREGGELTVIAYGAMVPLALAAAEAARRSDIEVLDLRSALPARRGGDPRLGRARPARC